VIDLTMSARLRIVVGAPPAKAERLPDDPQIGLVHSMFGGEMRTIVFVPESLRWLTEEEVSE